MSGVIWLPTGCKGYQQETLVGKEFMIIHNSNFMSVYSMVKTITQGAVDDKMHKTKGQALVINSKIYFTAILSYSVLVGKM